MKLFPDPSRMMISSDNLSEVQKKKLGEVFGIHAYHIAYKTESTEETICKVEIRRDFTYIYSEKIAGLGGYQLGHKPKEC